MVVISYLKGVKKNDKKYCFKALFSVLFLGVFAGFCLGNGVLFARKAAHGQ